MRKKLTDEEEQYIEDILFGQRYLSQEYVMPKKVETTSIKCPICGNLVILSQCGNSYGVNCTDENCFSYTVRGI